MRAYFCGNKFVLAFVRLTSCCHTDVEKDYFCSPRPVIALCVRTACALFKVEPVCAVGARLCILLLVLTLYRYIGFSWGRSGYSGFGIVGLFLVCAYDLCCAGSIFCEERAHGLLVHAACALLSHAYNLCVHMALPSAPV